ncbi:VanZ family protein [Brevundimonas bacteroides]|uniref:VanZ family protein n=1 Tax=Brevundimonas bacteroides TaxID=74311 RepID=UPI0012ECBB8D|nr:VanZ family protein [Brevundimonas bacteroides]
MTTREIIWLLRAVSLLPASALVGLFLGPVTPVVERLGLSDSQSHALAFFTVMSGLLILWPRQQVWILALVAFAVGGAIELAQGFTGRGPSFADLAANAVGISMGVFIFIVVHRAIKVGNHIVRRMSHPPSVALPSRLRITRSVRS